MKTPNILPIEDQRLWRQVHAALADQRANIPAAVVFKRLRTIHIERLKAEDEKLQTHSCNDLLGRSQ